MSRTLYGHYIATIKGDDYVLHKDYTELQNKYYKQKEVLDKIKEEVEYWGYEEQYNDDKVFCSCMKKIHELLEKIE